jgi:DNA repair exonuclease SbcCD ATPase subunit
MSDHLIAEANRHAKALTDERNNLVVELNLLREWQREVIQNARAHHAQLKDAIARAERAEASLHALRLVCGTTDADKFTSWVDRANDRAERAEAELREMGADKLRWAMLATDRGDQVQHAEAERIALVKANTELDNDYRLLHGRLVTSQAELAAERARLDWLKSDAGMDFQWQTVRVITRAAIDAAIKEGK